MRTTLKGFTLIEILVGIVIGMIVVAAASVMMVSVLKSQKDVTASARLNQELGAVMAVMSNEIRRAGFSVCDENDPAFTCTNADGTSKISYELGDDLKIGDVDGTVPSVKGDCILYRYNADVDDDANDLDEQRGFRLFVKPKDPTNPNDKDRGVIQLARPAGGVKCDDTHDFTNPTSNKWENLTNPDVIDIDVTLSSFSTTGSKCRNMGNNLYWVVGDGAKGLACEANTEPVTCTNILGGTLCGGLTKVPSESVWVNDDPTVLGYPLYTLFGVNQIRISLRATLTRDSAVSKNLQTSVKVANPWIQVKKP